MSLSLLVGRTVDAIYKLETMLFVMQVKVTYTAINHAFPMTRGDKNSTCPLVIMSEI